MKPALTFRITKEGSPARYFLTLAWDDMILVSGQHHRKQTCRLAITCLINHIANNNFTTVDETNPRPNRRPLIRERGEGGLQV